MAWFGRRSKTTYSGKVFADRVSLERWERKLADAELTFISEETTGENTYDTYFGNDPEKAKVFLRAEPVPNDYHYIVVETADGTWGTDSNSLYLEKLRPWQLATDDAECIGTINALVDGFHNLNLAAAGVVDNYLVKVACGRCGHEWIDGIRYLDVTLVRCPECVAANHVDSSDITATQIGFPGTPED